MGDHQFKRDQGESADNSYRAAGFPLQLQYARSFRILALVQRRPGRNFSNKAVDVRKPQRCSFFIGPATKALPPTPSSLVAIFFSRATKKLCFLSGR